MKYEQLRILYFGFINKILMVVTYAIFAMGVTHAEEHNFKVANVEIAKKLLPEVDYRKAIEMRVGSPIESFPQVNKKLVYSDIHPFVQAVFDSFREHRPLTLSPDMVWLLIAQGFAEHVNNNAELLRKKFVTYQGKKHIYVKRDYFVKGSLNNPWEQVFPEFTEQIKTEVGAELLDLVIASFSTTGNIEKAAFEITLMDAMKSYFEYGMITGCGIPSITLEGIPKDWKLIVSKAKQLRQYDLEWWIDELIPVLEQFSDAAQGKIDVPFWNGFFKYIPPGGLSGDVAHINGWIIKFFPYLTIRQDKTQKNPYLHRSSDEKTGFDFDNFSQGLSKTELKWYYWGEVYNMEFLAGFIGVSQDAETKTLRPEIGWAIRDTPTTAEKK